ncbi:MAG: protein-glutamate O-methyltransferase CheR [Magnetococcales bacterium]|nr:protein-glutamate O-methyltransferase CheR [Magnetococcales bacterium]
MDEERIRDIEIHLLLEALRLRFGYEFHNYSRASLKRRILGCLSTCAFKRISDIIPLLLRDESFHQKLILALTVTVTEMYRDPEVFKSLKEHVFPVLKTWPFINVWHAGCASGEEVYSLAILLKEGGYLDRARIYATDINEEALCKAREGVYPAGHLRQYEENYRLAGGSECLAQSCHIRYELAMMHTDLRKNMVFANHNLATDGTFTETHLILCRNVLIYFNQELQDRVLRLFAESLIHGGFLCLGSKESLRFSSVADQFVPICSEARIFQKRLEPNHES